MEAGHILKSKNQWLAEGKTMSFNDLSKKEN
jgi:hypothetical protein